MTPRSQQKGMVLLVSLVLLLLLTVIAIVSASQASLQSRMASNSQQQNIAFQAAESGIRAWLDEYERTLDIDAIEVSGNLARAQGNEEVDSASFTASAPVPGNCWNVMPSFSLDAADGSTTFQYACFNIESDSRSCVGCSDATNPARARHLQGHLVRY
ncbi:hypothetical protein D9M69_535320 [compost metagenome]